MAPAICWQNLPPPVAFTVASVGAEAAAEATAAAALPVAAAEAPAAADAGTADAALEAFFDPQPLTRPAIAIAARVAAPKRWNEVLLTCVSPVRWVRVPATGRGATIA